MACCGFFGGGGGGGERSASTSDCSPVSFICQFRPTRAQNLLAIAVATDITFPEAEQVSDSLSAFPWIRFIFEIEFGMEQGTVFLFILTVS